MIAPATSASPAEEEVRAELARILAAPQFAASGHLRAFLAFVVEAALAGDTRRITAYRIGAEALKRGERFDPSTDPIVRIEATKLRRALERHYLADGRDDPVRIEVATGGYVPAFHVRGPPPAAMPDPSPAGDPEPPPAPVSGRRLGPPLRIVAALGFVVVLVIACGTWRLSAWGGGDGVRRASAIGPTLLVLPLEGLDGSEATKALAGGLTDELITGLLRFRQFRLFSRAASFGQPPDAPPGDLRRRLDADYVVRGSVRAEGAHLHVVASLVDARSGEIDWSRGYDRELTPAGSVAVLEDLAGNIAAHLAGPDGAVGAAASGAPAGAAPESLASYLCVLKSYAYRRSRQPATRPEVEGCLAEAVRRDPYYPEAWAMRAMVALDGYRWGDRPGADAGPILASARDAAERALALAPRNIVALTAMSGVAFHEGDTAEAERLIRQAVDLNPEDPETLALLGVRIAFPGRWEEGLPYLDRAAERVLQPPVWLPLARGMTRYMLGDLRGALADAEAGQGCCAGGGMGAALLAAVRAQLGDGKGARDALAAAEARSPLLARDPRAFYGAWQLREADVAKLLDGLRKAGLRDPVS